MIKAFFILLCCFTSFSGFSDEKIDWQLGSSPDFVKEAQEILGTVDDEIKNSKGIRQLLLQSTISLEEDIITNQVKKIWYFSDAGAMQNYGTDVIYFNNFTESVKVLEALIIKPDGKIIQFDVSKALINDSDSYNSFSNTKKLIIPYPSLQTGSIAIINYVINTKRKQLESDWSETYFPQTQYPRENFQLSVVDNNKEQDFTWYLSSKYITCNKNENKLTCSGNKIPAQTTNDSIFWYDKIGQVIVSESSSWQHVIDKVNTAFDSAKENTEGVTELLASLTKNEANREDKIAAIHKFVASEIRYVAVSSNGHSITPHLIAETLKNRYGDCKDKSVLLIELLKNIGVNAYPVLVSTKRTEPTLLKIPAMNYFNHVVACFPLKKKTMCLDATDSSTSWKDTSAWIQGKVSLTLKDNKRPEVIPINKYRWSIKIKTGNVFLADGQLKENQSRIYYSEYASAIREKIKDKTPDQVKRWALDQYQETISNKVKPDFDFSDFQSINKDITISSKTVHELSLDINKELSYTDYDYWLRSEIDFLYAKNKDFDNFISGINVTSEQIYDASNYWKITGSFPQKNLQHRFGKLEQKIKINNAKNKVHIETQVKIPAQTISIKDKKEFNKFLDIIKRESSIHLTGKPKLTKE